MNNQPHSEVISSRSRNLWILIAVCMLVIAVLACVIPGTSNKSPSLVETQTSINVQLTMMAMNRNQVNEGGDNDPNQQETQIAQSVQATGLANDIARATDAAAAAAAKPTVAPPPVQQPNPPQAGAAAAPAAANLPDFETWMKKASILLYEDMAGRTDTTRYVQSALEGLSLKPAMDDKDAGGNFLRDLKSGGPAGPWDLIISASEARTAIQGEFIPALMDNINAGSSLVMEHWNIDGIANGRIATLLASCGVVFEQDLAYNPPVCMLPPDENFLILWPQDPGNPILTTPNSGLRLSSMSRYWSKWYTFNCGLGLWAGTYDYGDQLALAPGSKAKLVLGTHSDNNDKHGVLANCRDGRLTLWTSSTHNYEFSRVLPLWQNMIYNALKARYTYMGSQ